MTREREILRALKQVSGYYDTCIFRATGRHDGCPFHVGNECALEQFDVIPKAEENVEQMDKDAGSIKKYEGVPVQCCRCGELSVNYNTEEAYCKAADGREIALRQGSGRPEWCPKHGKEGSAK